MVHAKTKATNPDDNGGQIARLVGRQRQGNRELTREGLIRGCEGPMGGRMTRKYEKDAQKQRKSQEAKCVIDKTRQAATRVGGREGAARSGEAWERKTQQVDRSLAWIARYKKRSAEVCFWSFF